MGPEALGIDIGGTYVRAALVSAAGDIVQRVVLPTPANPSETDLAAVVQQALRGLDPLAGRVPAGFVLPGRWSRATGVMARANNLPKLEGVNVPLLAVRAAGRAVEVVDSDVVAAGWAQWSAMRPRPRAFLYLSLGTGVGGAVIVDGHVLRDAEGGTHGLGALTLDQPTSAPTGGTTARQTLEAIVCEVSDPPLAPRAVLALGAALIRITGAHGGVEVIALGGGRIDRQAQAVDEIRAEYRRRAGECGVAAASVVRAPLSSDDAGVIGAALLAISSARGS